MPQAILTKDVPELGETGDAIEVSNGYLRNYLMPRKLAIPASKGALEEVRRQKEEQERAEREAAERADEIASILSRTVLTIQHRAGEDGKLFGSVTSKEIAEAINAARNLRIDRKKVVLEEPIRSVGAYQVEVIVHGDVRASVKTIVTEKK